jgi:glycosyltransferase involved in cell wall biosynthesis
MSVYFKDNAEDLNDSINSIYCLQSLKPNQIVIVCDGILTTDLYFIINFWKQKLNNIFFVLQLNKNSGLAIALNEGLKYCKYDYVARMDSDDFSSPDRFKIQLKYLSNHPEVTIIGSNVYEFSDNIKRITFKKKVPNLDNDFNNFIKYRNPINHMSVVFKKNDILSVGGYDSIIGYEDYLLWVKLFVKGYKLFNISDYLVYARIDNGFISRRKGYNLFKNEIILQFKFYNLGLFGLNILFYNLFFRSISRLLPNSILKNIYNKLRDE